MKNWRMIGSSLHLVDRCLLIIFGILILQITLNLLLRETNMQQSNTIDVVVRTSAAAIFGYLVSANFNQRHRRGGDAAGSDAPPLLGQTAARGEAPRGKIGFSALPAAEEQTLPPKLFRRTDCGDSTQILVITGVGVLSLCVLLILRQMDLQSPAATATISQLRDFVSGSVGFLISCSTGDARWREG